MRRVVAGFLMVVFLAACSSEPQTSEGLAKSDLIVTDIQKAPIEYKLAYLDSGHLPRGTDVNASRIRFLLKYLSEKTGDNSQSIADRTSVATSVLKDNYGRAVTNQGFLEEAYEYFEGGGPKTGFNDLASLLTLIMSK